MKNTIALAAVAGLASISTAQVVGIVATDSSTSVLNIPGPTTVNFSIVMIDDGGLDIEGFDLAVTTSAGTASNPVVLQEGFFATAQIDGGRVEVAAGDSFSGEADDYQTGFTLATFDVTFDAGFSGTVTLELSIGDNSTLGNDGFPLVLNTGGFPPIPVGQSATLNDLRYDVIIPTPGAAAVLGLGGLVAARRRR